MLKQVALAAVLVGSVSPGCRAPQQVPSIASDAEAAAPRALGVSRSKTLPLEVRVLGARQVAAATVQVELEVVRADGTSAPASPDALRAAVAGLGGVSVVTADGRRRLFPLRGDRPAEEPGLPAAGASHRFRVLFPLDPEARGPLTLLLPGFAPISGVPVS